MLAKIKKMTRAQLAAYLERNLFEVFDDEPTEDLRMIAMGHYLQSL